MAGHTHVRVDQVLSKPPLNPVVAPGRSRLIEREGPTVFDPRSKATLKVVEYLVGLVDEKLLDFFFLQSARLVARQPGLYGQRGLRQRELDISLDRQIWVKLSQRTFPGANAWVTSLLDILGKFVAHLLPPRQLRVEPHARDGNRQCRFRAVHRLALSGDAGRRRDFLLPVLGKQVDDQRLNLRWLDQANLLHHGGGFRGSRILGFGQDHRSTEQGERSLVQLV